MTIELRSIQRYEHYRCLSLYGDIETKPTKMHVPIYNTIK